jgi:hypothetical protein
VPEPSDRDHFTGAASSCAHSLDTGSRLTAVSWRAAPRCGAPRR